MVVELFLAPMVEVTVSNVIFTVTEHLNLMVGYKEELTTFLRTLKIIRGVLPDAEEKKSNHRVKAWLQQLRGVMEEVDPLLEEISHGAVREEVAHQKEKLKKVSNFFPSSNPIGDKIMKLNVALDKLNRRASGLGLQNMIPNQVVPFQHTDPSLGDPSEVIGREGDCDKIVKLLVESSNDQPLDVVSIVGVGGLGKTTLAKLVCKDKQVESYFSKIIWVCVSEKFDVRSILAEVLESIDKCSCNNISNEDNLVSSIKDMLQDKNYLLVLDGVCNEDEKKWKNLRNRLLAITHSVRSSKVLVTTRFPGVVSMMGSVIGSIEHLKDEDCWSIFKQRAFKNSPVPQELEEIGRIIASKCRGVPLVANVAGSILGRNMDKNHWLLFEKSFDTYSSDRVLQALKLCFDHLPRFVLKQCFAFCSVFAKNSVIEKEMLVQVWMAQRFLPQPPHGSHKEMEDICEEYFMELVSCYFFQDVKKDFYGRIVSCTMHDLMHDLAISVSQSEALVLDDSSIRDIRGIQHLNLLCPPSMQPAKMVEILQNLHSLFSKVDVFSGKPVKLRRLLVLSFRGADICQLPSHLDELEHLSYFDISETNIKETPSFVSKLHHLQTFRYLKCRFLERPIEGIGNLVKLKHIYFDDENLMPAGLGSVTSLQTLPLFAVSRQEGCGIEELECLGQLKGDLKICNLQNVRNKAEAVRAKLKEKIRITELVLEFSSEEGEDRNHHADVLEGLEPHSNLKGLILKGYGGKKCPKWMLESTSDLVGSACLVNVLYVEFSGCDQLESIPSLLLNKETKLKITMCKSLKDVAVSSLKNLTIEDCSELVSVRFGSLAITFLKELDIQRCDKLENLPMVSKLSALQVFCLRECCKLKWVGDCGSSLRTVSVENFQTLIRIEGESLAATSLKCLCISSCPALLSIPSLDGLSSVQTISIKNCQQLRNIGHTFSSSTCLQSLSIVCCQSMVSFPSLKGVTSLQHLSISRCGLRTLPEGFSLLSHLCQLELGGFSEEFEGFPDLRFIQLFRSSLSELSLIGWGKLKHLPDQIQYLTALKALRIEDLDGLVALPDWLRNLSSLQTLALSGCSSLKHLPSMGSMRSLSKLQKLEITRCDNLQVVSESDKILRIETIVVDSIPV